MPPAETHSADQVASLVRCRAATGIQPKSSKLPPLVREHKSVFVVRGPHESLVKCGVKPMERVKHPKTIPPDCDISHEVSEIPSESQLLRFTPLRSRGGSDKVFDRGSDSHKFDCHKATQFEQAWGIPYKPSEFVREAVVAGHPHHIKNLIPEVLAKAIRKNTELSSHEICAGRAEWFKMWLARSRELQADELELKKTIHPDVAKIIEPKRILLWKEMLQRILTWVLLRK